MSNRRIQSGSTERIVRWSSNDHIRIGLALTPRRGLGLVAFDRIRKGERVAGFDGEIYHWRPTVNNLTNDAPYYIRDHAVQIGPYRSRDSAGIARYANHSCDPNCGITGGIWITPMRDILPGEELTWDYAMTEDNDWEMTCDCGSPLCRKVIRGYRHLPPERRAAYQGYLGDWLAASNPPYAAHDTPFPVAV